MLIDPVPDGKFDVGLPAATVAYCTGVALALGALMGAAVSGLGVAIQVRLPEVMAASYESAFCMRPGPPQPAPGGGWLHADLGAPGDREAFETMMATLPAAADAGVVARSAQEWRLPVCDYRPLVRRPATVPWVFEPGASRPASPALRVLDLTSMWAGPLATWLLRSLGASVTRVEPAFRPDGFRALDGGGIHPDGRPCDPGRDSGMWNALNVGKATEDLDLRVAGDRRRFLELAAVSDVVIDSFSPRVMPNFGLELPAGPLYASMPAFPPGPQRDWVGYGTGIHAASGLGEVGEGRFAGPAVSYPDPVAGFTAALGVMAAVVGRARGVPVGRVECPLASAVQPLVKFGGPVVGGELSPVGRELLDAGRAAGRLELGAVCGQPRWHPARASVFPAWR